MSMLILVEHDNTSVKASTFNTLAAALKLADEVTALVVGHGCETIAADISKLKGISQVLLADNACYQHFLPESVAPLVQHLAANVDYILAPATTFGKNILPRAAAMLGVEPVASVIEIVDKQTFKRPIYAGNAIETVQTEQHPLCLSIRTTAFAPEKGESEQPAAVEKLEFASDNQQSEFISAELHTSDRPELSSAEVVISGGRGLQDKAGFDRMVQLADRLNAAVGASRAAVDAGLAPNDWQVGQTGQVVAPKLYIALGISGAIQHLAGMKDSKVIVAINKDADAPIFQVADYGLVADMNDVFPAWEKVLTDMGYS